jgi:peptide/nickel transport system permease protein
MRWIPAFEGSNRLDDIAQDAASLPSISNQDQGVVGSHIALSGTVHAKDQSNYRPPSFCEAMGASFWLALMWLIIIAFLALTAELWPLPPYDYIDWQNPAAVPGSEVAMPMKSSDHQTINQVFVCLLGTDTMGRDILTRLIYGARVSLAVGLLTPCFGILIGGLLGMLAGYYRGRLESLLMVTMDALLAFPALVLLLVITFYLGAGLVNIILAMGFLSIPHFARVARANTLAFAEREFVQSARMLGQTDVSIMVREIMPNLIMPLMVYALLVVSYMIVAEGALSFLGLGVAPPTPSWGGMIAEGKEMLDEAPHISLLPALILFLTVLAFNLIGDAVKRVLDSKEGQL